ncbi:hypothetical protein RA29_11225 [Tateyamaria sp. ANG-S1]|nr:hypothetical protein RA29_11225 [Tateyamaria sp. ANG-S1]
MQFGCIYLVKLLPFLLIVKRRSAVMAELVNWPNPASEFSPIKKNQTYVIVVWFVSLKVGFMTI